MHIFCGEAFEESQSGRELAVLVEHNGERK
jgi:hypothetical protein